MSYSDGTMRVSGPYQVESSCVLPMKSKNLMRRAAIAWSSIPDNMAHQYGVAYATAYSSMQSKPDDELMHGFARSRTHCENVAQNYRAEQVLLPLAYPTTVQKPQNLAFTSRSERVINYDKLAPIGPGTYASRTWI